MSRRQSHDSRATKSAGFDWKSCVRGALGRVQRQDCFCTICSDYCICAASPLYGMYWLLLLAGLTGHDNELYVSDALKSHSMTQTARVADD
jgi:hypothetical protein